MKKTIAFLLLLACILTFSACGESDEPDAPTGMKLASNLEIVDYSLYVPEDWELVTSTGMTMAQDSIYRSNVIITHHANDRIPPYSDVKQILNEYFYANKDAEYSETMLASPNGYLADLISLFDTTVDENGNEVTSFAMVTEPAFTTLKKGSSEIPAIKLTYTASLDTSDPNSNTTVRQTTLVAYDDDDDYFYNITLTCFDYIHEEFDQPFETILEHLTFH